MQTQSVLSPADLLAAPPGKPGAPNFPKVKFAGGDAFLKSVKHRVDQYFQSTGRSPRD